MSTAPQPRGRQVSTGPARAGDGQGLLRLGLHLLLAALPLLAISAHVFGLVRMQLSAAILVIPLATALIALTVFAPHAGDRVLAHGMVWGIVACAIYDVFRLDTVYMLGWWADFIPTMGTWITGNPDDLVSGAIVGYLWRYIGDGGGIGITFFALASAVGLHQRSRRTVVLTCIAFAVFPVWAGLVGTVALATDGQTMMFPLTPTTITLSLIGHLIFGWILGLGFWHSRSVQQHWPWEPLAGLQGFLGGFARERVAPAASAPTAFTAHPAPGHPAPAGPPSGGMRVEPTSPAVAWGSPVAQPASGPPSGPMSGPMSGPASGPVSHPIPRPSGPPPISGPLPALPTARVSRPAPVAAAAGAGSAGLTDSAPVPTGGQAGPVGGVPSEPVPAHRDPGTPPAGQSMGPETWELWQRQLQTTVRGRRTHGTPRSVRSRSRS